MINVFSCTVRFVRNEKNNLIGFDQDAYPACSDADNRHFDSIFEEYEAVRRATIALFNGLPDQAFDRLEHGTGTANAATVRALAYRIAGHELHHLNLIKENTWSVKVFKFLFCLFKSSPRG